MLHHKEVSRLQCGMDGSRNLHRGEGGEETREESGLGGVRHFLRCPCRGGNSQWSEIVVMKETFKHPVLYDGEVIAICPSEEEASRFHQAIHGSAFELEIVPPPPPSAPPPPMVGDSGIPAHLFESGQSEMLGGEDILHGVEVKSPEHLAKLTESYKIVGKDQIGGKVLLTLKRR